MRSGPPRIGEAQNHRHSGWLLFVQALNIVRIISLFYLGQWNYTVFEWFHLYLWPVLIMLDVLVVFAIYLQWLGKQHHVVTPP